MYFFSVLLINIGIARFFAAEKSGQIFYIVNNLALMLLIASISLESGSTYYVASGKLEAALMANFCLVWATGHSLIAVGGWGMVLYLSHSDYLQNLPISGILFLFYPGSTIYHLFYCIVLCKERIRTSK